MSIFYCVVHTDRLLLIQFRRHESDPMSKKIHLNSYDRDIERHLEDQPALPNLSEEMQALMQAAKDHVRQKSSVI